MRRYESANHRPPWWSRFRPLLLAPRSGSLVRFVSPHLLRSKRTRKIGEQVAVVEIGTTMEDDDWPSLSDIAIVELALSDRSITFARSRRTGWEISAHTTTLRHGRSNVCLCAPGQARWPVWISRAAASG